MRLGIVMIPRHLSADAASMIDHVSDVARRVEELDFHGLWVTDAFARGWPTLDPLVVLGALSAVTRRIELGTCVVQLPIRHPVEHAHRVQTVNLLSRGRLQFGIGTGSTRADFEAVQADFDGRFKALPGILDVMQRTWRGEPVYGPALTQWPGTEGGPPVLLGAWRSPRWINLAATRCQGWIASGIYGSLDDARQGLAMFREAGGKRAVIANIFTDLRPEPHTPPITRPLGVSLVCPPSAARERLHQLAEIGFDDALLACPMDDLGQLEAIRALM